MKQLDGTLWDSAESCAVVWNRIVREQGMVFPEVTGDDVRRVTGKPLVECVRLTFAGLSERELQVLIRETATQELLNLEAGGKAFLYPGVRDGLERLRAMVPLFIVSNCQSGYIESFLEWSKLSSLFSDFECHGNTGRPKGENILRLMHRNRLMNPVYVGDTVGDQAAAEEATVRFVFVSYGFGKVTRFWKQFDSFETLTKEMETIGC